MNTQNLINFTIIQYTEWTVIQENLLNVKRYQVAKPTNLNCHVIYRSCLEV